MFKIESTLSPRWEYDLSNITVEDLSYRLFLGSVKLSGDNQEMNFDYDWIPLVDFASAMLRIQRKFSSGLSTHETFEFTESDEKLIFELSDDLVSIDSKRTKERLVVSLDDYSAGVVKNYVDLVSQLITKYPDIRISPSFKRYIEEAHKLVMDIYDQ